MLWTNQITLAQRRKGKINEVLKVQKLLIMYDKAGCTATTVIREKGDVMQHKPSGHM